MPLSMEAWTGVKRTGPSGRTLRALVDLFTGSGRCTDGGMDVATDLDAA